MSDIKRYEITLKQQMKVSKLESIDYKIKCKPYIWGICTSDLITFNQGTGKYFGHEMILKVVDSKISSFKKDDFIIPFHTKIRGEYFDSSGPFLKLGYQSHYEFGFEELSNLIKINKCSKMKNMVFLDTVACVIHAIKKSFTAQQTVILGDGFVAQIFFKVLALSCPFENIKIYSRND